MKGILKSLVTAITVVVGYKAGSWLWSNVLEEKANNLKDRLTNKD